MDFSDLGICQLALRVSFSFDIRPVASAIFSIFLFSSPSNIGNIVVKSISVVMAALHAFGTRANECQKNKLVSGSVIRFAISSKRYFSIPRPVNIEAEFVPRIAYERTSAFAPSESFVLPACPHRSIAADTVSGKSWHVTVLDRLRNVIEQRRLNNSHDRPFHEKGGCGVGSGCNEHSLARFILSKSCQENSAVSP